MIIDNNNWVLLGLICATGVMASQGPGSRAWIRVIIIINNWILTGLICPTEFWRPGTSQDLPTHWPGTCVWTRVCRGNAPYAVEGRNFHGPQCDAAWLFLTVFIASPAFSRSFSSPTRCMGFADSPPVDVKLLMQLLYHRELATPPRFPFMVGLPRVCGTNFVELCNIFAHFCSSCYFYLVSPCWTDILPWFYTSLWTK